MFTRYSCWKTCPVDIHLSFKFLSVNYGISWKCSDPSCTSQGVFTSSAIQALASHSDDNWPLCWSFCEASVRDFNHACHEWILVHLPLRSSRSFYCKPYLVRNVFEVSLLDDYHLLRCSTTSSILKNFFNFIVRSLFVIIAVSLCLVTSVIFLHDDFSHPPTSSKSIARPCSTTEPNKSTEHSAIQKGRVHCTVVAIHVSRLLSNIFNFGNFDHSWWAIFVCLVGVISRL